MCSPAIFGSQGTMDQFPHAERLTRLHLVDTTGRLHLPPDFTHNLSRLYPHLTHLRIFGFVDERLSGDLFPAIEELVHGEDPTSNSESTSGSCPSRPFHIAVIPGKRTNSICRFRGKTAYKLMTEKLYNLALEESASEQLVLPYHGGWYYEYMDYEFAGLEKWWLEW